MKKVLSHAGKRCIAVILTMTLIFAFCLSSAFADNNYSDVKGHWAETAINNWSDNGVLQGDNGKFHPNDSITRAEMATVCANVLGLQNQSANNFSDVKADTWYTGAILKCAAAGILQGDGQAARPNDSITREEAAVMIGRALTFEESQSGAEKFTDKADISSWALGYVNTLAGKGYISGFEGKFNPAADITRAEVITIFDNTIAKYIGKAGNYDGNVNGLVVIAANSVTLDKAAVNGNIILAPGADKGTINLADSKVTGNIEVQTPLTINIKGSSAVDEITVDKAGQGTVINVEKGAAVKQLNSNADKVTVNGSGSVTKAAVNGNNNAINTTNTTITEGKNVTGTTVNGKEFGKNTSTNSGSGSGGGGGGGSNTALKTAKADLKTQIDAATALQGDTTKLLHDWSILATGLTDANNAYAASDITNIKAATTNLKTAIATVNNVNSKDAIAKTLTVNNFATEADFDALAAPLAAVEALNATSTQADVDTALTNLATVLAKATVEAAKLTGNTVTNNWQVNQDGVKIEINLDGYNFKNNVNDYKQAIVDNIDFYGLKYDKTQHQYNQVPLSDFITQCLNNYGTSGYFAVLKGRVSVYDRFVGLSPKGAKSVVLDQDLIDDPTLADSYPGVEKGIRNALVKEGTFTINDKGNLVITCDNKGYFKTFCNQVPVCNGGIQIVQADVMLNFKMPAAVIEQGVNVSTATNDLYKIQEMKMHAEVWQYTTAEEALDSDGNLKDGYFSFYQSIQSADKNAQARQYDKTYYLKQVDGNTLTEADIRQGGTAGPNGTGNKLIKICIDTRVGPAQWASAKNTRQFVTNLFRTSADATGYSGSTDAYTPADDAQWLKVENKMVETYATTTASYNLVNLAYLVNYSGDSRGDVTNTAPMWMFFEVPKVADFNIDKNMNLYLNTIAGMFGGSGQSESNGMPILGMDGRYSMTISATNDSDLQ